VVGKNSPTLVSGGLTFQSVSAGSNHSCAISTSGDGMCWGQREFGQVKWDIIDFTPTVVTIVP
jgi:alpha-tubulin suppressor-like RCC1 family protein